MTEVGYDDEEASSGSGSDGRGYQHTSQDDLVSEPDYDAGAAFLVLGKEPSGSSRYLDEDQVKVLDRNLQRQKQESVLKQFDILKES